ncbi:MAG TPA: heavy metal-associated domain-containing protein [Bacteroidales bacterium]|nr:heavy metal-associated domain-containing protein [Bacteroidales bacterium]
MKAKNVIITTLVLAVFLLVSNVSFSQNVKKNEKEIKITTSAVCGMCKTRIEEGLAFEKGIKDAVLDLDTKVLTVVYNTKKTNEEQILTLINNMGYDANDTRANPEAYNKLPACCKNHDGHKCTH